MIRGRVTASRMQIPCTLHGTIRSQGMSSKLDRFIERSAQIRAEIHSLQAKGNGPEQAPIEKGWHPRFEVYHHQDALFIDVELPGVPSEGVIVEPRPDMVNLRGEKPSLGDLPDREEIASSREYGPFSCQFAIPRGFVLDHLDQRLANGVLHLKIRIAPRPVLPEGQ